MDPRVKPCIVDFLYTRMQKYAVAHNWEFDQSDFDCFKVDAEAWREVEAPASAPTPIQALSKERRPSDEDTTAPTGNAPAPSAANPPVARITAGATAAFSTRTSS